MRFELGQVCSRLSSGKGIPANQVFDSGEYPVYGGNGLRGYTDHSNFEGECAIIGRQGAFCGNVRFFSGKAYMTEHAVVVCANEYNNTRYLAYLLSTMNLGRLSGQSAQPGLSVKTLAKQELELPVLETQDKIVSILASLDDKIGLNQRINENLYEQLTSYYKHLFSAITPSTSVGELADSIFSGGTPSTSNEAYWNGDYYWLSSGETSERFIVSTIKTITDAGASNSSTRKANKYDIVIASAGQGHTRGQTSMLLTDTYVNQSIIVVHAAPDYLPYLFWNIANRYEELRVISNSNSIRGSLTTKMIGSLSIPKADITQIRQFSDHAWPIVKAVENNLHENRRLAVMRDTLLPRLMSGKLDVSGLDL